MFNLPRLGKRIEEILGGFGNQVNRTIGGLGQQANNVGNQAQRGINQIQRQATNTARQNVNVINQQVQQVQRQVPQVDFTQLSRRIANAANPVNQVKYQLDAVNKNVLQPLNTYNDQTAMKQYGINQQQLNELKTKSVLDKAKFAVNRPLELNKQNPMMGIIGSPLNPTQAAFQAQNNSPINLPKVDLTKKVDEISAGYKDTALAKTPYVGDAVGFAGENIVNPIAKSFARYGDVTQGQQRYSDGSKGLAEGATDTFNIASMAYTPLKAGKLAQGGKVALKAVPGAFARGAGAGAGTSALNQYADTGKVDPMTTLMSAGIGGVANVGLPYAGGLLKRGGKQAIAMEKARIASGEMPGGFAKLPGGNQADDLFKEARKYKSAEEFVRVQGTPVYHGTNYANARQIQQTGLNPESATSIKGGKKFVFLTGDEQYAKSYATQKGGDNSFVLSVKKPADTIIEESTYRKGMKFPDLVSQKTIPPEDIIIKGKDGKWYPIKEFNFFTGEADTYIGKTPVVIKTKSQLTNLYNQATKGVESKGKPILELAPKADNLANEARKYKSADEFVKAQTNLYHGTKADFSEFDPNLLGTNTGAPSAKKGFFFTNNEQLANHYANPGRNQGTAISKNLEDAMGRAVERAKKEGLDNSLSNNTGGAMVVGSWPKTAKATEVKSSILSKMETLKSRFDSPEDIKKINRFQQLVTEELDNTKLTDLELSGKVLKSKVNLENPMVFDDNGLRNGASYAKRIDEAIAKGHDGVIIKNTQDPFRGDIHVAFDKNQILTEKQLTDLYNQATKGVESKGKPKVELKQPDVDLDTRAKAAAFEAYQKTGSRTEYTKVYNQVKNGTSESTVGKATLKGLGNNDVVPGNVTNAGTLMGDLQRYALDKDAPLLNLARKLEQQDPVGNKGMLDEIYYATGLQRRSNSIANQRINESDSLSGAFRGLSKEQAAQFDDYVAAHRGLQDAKEGKPTNLTEGELQAIVTELSPIYQERFSQLNNYYKEWAKHLYEGGIISDAKLKTYLANNDYTRIQRDMEDLVNFNTPGKAMSAKVNGVTNQRRKGSTRDILPAAETAVGYAQHAQAEIQRNKSASTLIDMLAPNGMAKRVSAKDAVHRNTINVKRNGKVEIWEVPKDIKELADQVSPYTLGTLGKIIAFPQRLLRAGATGLSAPFTAANYIKDQGSSAIFSKDARATSFNLKNIADGLFQASKDFGYKTNDPAWNKFMLHMGDDTQYHGIRNTANIKDISRELRTGQKGKYVNMAKHSIRTLEDLNSVTEKATRFQHFKGIYDKAIKNGASEADATKAATLAAWQNSTDFSRMGDASRAVNLLIPYFNAGIQGTRLMGRRLREAPVATGAKILGFAGLPLAAVTAYNMMDPERKKVYDNISPYEKENNFILVLPGAEQGEDGTYEGVLKIPIQQGLSDVIQPIRRSMEAFQNQSPLDFAAIGGDIISSISGPIETKSLESFGGSLTPQVAKPIVQQALNKDLYTGKQIIPDYMNDSTDADGNPTPESKKAYENTSGSSRWIAEKLGVSPLRVDKFIKDTSSKVGQYSQNELDKVLASTGAIPKNQIGGVFIADDFIRRFGKASGVENFKKSEGAKYYDTIKEVTAGFNKNELAAYNSLHPSKKNFLGERILEDDSTYDPAARLDIYNRFSKVFEADKRMDLKNREKGEPGNPLFDLTPAQVKKVLEKDNLPPGAKDPELSNLYSQDWYAEYKNRKTAFFEQLKSKAKAENRQFGSSDNPYPNTPPELQKVMDYYNNLPSGTGARSQWIRSNPGLFDAMKGQWAAVDEWQNVARGKRGLAATEGEAGVANGFGTGSSTKYASSGGSGGSGGGSDGFNPYKYNVSMKTGKINKPTVKMLAGGTKISAVKSGAPKVSIKKSKV